ncbi:MAG: hypothetical protein GW763_15400 [Paraglaciecola sp.]|nr:hypothetical protein [Paraglaciecola sp.]NCT49337.1 hypothetical protein [Paraglaciecola sp.]
MPKLLTCLIVLSTILSISACQFLSEFSNSSNLAEEETSINASMAEAPTELPDMTWLDYADPVADANLAVAKQNFNLLALGNRRLNFPGVELAADELDKMQADCGVKVMAHSGDQLNSADELPWRKKLFTYVSQYNTVMLAACKHQASTASF